MSWRIQIPNRGRDQSIVDALCDVRHVEDAEERAVARRILEEAAEEGARSVGHVLDRLDRLEPLERRRLLDDARAYLGLPTTDDVVATAAFTAANEAAHRRAARRSTPTCAVCGKRPTGPGGMPAEVGAVRKYHCPDHEHLAGAGDLEPATLPIGLNMSYVDPDEAARENREDERRREEDAKRIRDRRAEAEAVRIARERYIEKYKDDPYVNPFSGAGWKAPS